MNIDRLTLPKIGGRHFCLLIELPNPAERCLVLQRVISLRALERFPFLWSQLPLGLLLQFVLFAFLLLLQGKVVHPGLISFCCNVSVLLLPGKVVHPGLISFCNVFVLLLLGKVIHPGLISFCFNAFVLPLLYNVIEPGPIPDTLELVHPRGI